MAANSRVPSMILAPSKAHRNTISVDKHTGFVAASDKVEINWVHTFMLVAPPIIGIYGLFTTQLMLPTFILAFLMYIWTGLGITAGYHRLWSHRAYNASWIVRFFLVLGGAGAFEGSAKWWCRNHRAHHRYTDTDKDPYNAKRGFFYAHAGWLIQKQNVNQIGFADINDLNRDPMITWQHKYYPVISIFIGLVLPTLIGATWGDAWGAYIYAGIWKMIGVHHATFFVNSLAHTVGDKTFSDHHTAYDSLITALMTFGEGYHNYHHEFPQDYRNGIKAWHYDPTKWFIKGLNLIGHTFDLKYIDQEEVEKAKVQMNQRRLDNDLTKLRRNITLPSITMDEFHIRVNHGEQLIIIHGVVHDVKNFVHEHPGGRQTLLNFIGTDSTSLFEGEEGAHLHSKEARKFLNNMRVASIRQTDIGA